VSGNASFLSAVQVAGATVLGSTLNVSSNTQLRGNLNVLGETTVQRLNVSDLNLINGLVYNPYSNVYKIPDGEYIYIRANLLDNKYIFNASYIAPVSGFYHVEGSLNLTSNLRTTWYSSLETNNASNVSFAYKSPFVKSSYFSSTMKEVIKLNKGEVVNATIYCGVNVNIQSTGSVLRTSLMTQY
jgi:hypothetical protein